jgi:hypothetical protein
MRWPTGWYYARESSPVQTQKYFDKNRLSLGTCGSTGGLYRHERELLTDSRTKEAHEPLTSYIPASHLLCNEEKLRCRSGTQAAPKVTFYISSDRLYRIVLWRREAEYSVVQTGNLETQGIEEEERKHRGTQKYVHVNLWTEVGHRQLTRK